MKEPSTDQPQSLTFWRNWYDACRYLPDEQRLASYDAIMAFAFDGTEPDPKNGVGYGAVCYVRAAVAISRKRRQSGSKGGKARSKTEAKLKHTEANPNQEQVQVQVQEQEQEQYANSSSAMRTKKPPTLKQFLAGAVTVGAPEEFARGLHAELETAGWADGHGSPIGNWRRYLKTAWNDEQKKIAARVVDSQRERFVDYEGVV